MLRITTEQKKGSTSFLLEGKLIGDWVGELERCWISAKNTEPGQQVRIDLNEVDFVDEKGENLLEQMASEGVELRADSLLMRFVISGVIERSKMEHASR